MNATILLLGFLFGAILQYAKLNRYNVISGMATLENFAVAKAIAVAIGAGVVIIAIEIGLGFATYHIKPFIVRGNCNRRNYIWYRNGNFRILPGNTSRFSW